MSQEIAPAKPEPKQTLLHPYSGAAILGLDWLLFSGNVLTAGASTVLTSVGGFFGAGIVVTLIQRRAGGDGWLRSLGKGLLAGVVVGVPFPIIGTFVGGVVLAVSGLDFVKKLGRKPDGG